MFIVIGPVGKISPLIPTAAVPVAYGIGCVIRHAVAGITVKFPTQDFILRGVIYILILVWHPMGDADDLGQQLDISRHVMVGR